MPSIFSEKQKEELRARMLDEGYDLIGTNGMRNLKVIDVTQAVSIAKGTFYSFFSSKEDFIYEIMTSKRKIGLQYFDDLLDENGQMDADGMYRFLTRLWSSGDNIYRHMDADDYYYLKTNWPEDYIFDPEKDAKVTGNILGHLKGLREGCEWRVVANLMKNLAVICIYREDMHQEVFEETLDAAIRSIILYAFGHAPSIESENQALA